MTTTKGPRPIYAPKVRPSRSCLLTGLANGILDAAMGRTGQNSSTIVEHLIRTHGGSLSGEEFSTLQESAMADGLLST